MFSLFYGLYKYLFKKDEFFVLILGLDNAGKTVRIIGLLVTFHCVGLGVDHYIALRMKI